MKLFWIASRKEGLPEDFATVGVGCKAMSDEEFRRTVGDRFERRTYFGFRQVRFDDEQNND